MAQYFRSIFFSILCIHFVLAGCQNPSNPTRLSQSPTPENLVQQIYLNCDSLPKKYFCSPLNIPYNLSAHFGEIRANHFHGGIDCAGSNILNKPVFAAAEGYVSRIKISPWGGGKHIYITHPNGYRTVYMHLNGYAGLLDTFVHNYQYAHHTYAFDIDLPPDSIPITQGQIIAYVGNTGSSSGAHLHYEIRFASNDQPINPFYFGLNYYDSNPPVIENIKLYPANKQTAINGKNSEWIRIETIRKGKKSTNVRHDTAIVAGEFYVGVYAYDRSELKRGRNGVERIELFVDGQLFHTYSVPTYLYEETRAINAVIDYPQYCRNKEYYIISRQLPGCRYPVTKSAKDNGYLLFIDTLTHQLCYRVSDYKGNHVEDTIYIQSAPSQLITQNKVTKPMGPPIKYLTPFTLNHDDFIAEIQARTLYDDDWMLYTSSSSTNPRIIGKVHTIKPAINNLPPHNAYTIKLRIPKDIKIPHSKLIIVSVSGKNIYAQETRTEGEYLKSHVKSFSSFAIATDTVSPKLTPSNFTDGKSFRNSNLILKVADNLSGIATYNCYVNQQWILAEYDPKSNTLTSSVENILIPGQNHIRYIVSDAVGNVSDLSYTIIR